MSFAPTSTLAVEPSSGIVVSSISTIEVVVTLDGWAASIVSGTSMPSSRQVLQPDDDAVAVFGRFGPGGDRQVFRNIEESAGQLAGAQVVAQGDRRSRFLGAEFPGGDIVDRSGLRGEPVAQRNQCRPGSP